MAGENGPMRKAGSGTRVEERNAHTQNSYVTLASAAQSNNKPVFVTKHSFVKARASKASAHVANKQQAAENISLGNMKSGGGHVRQIKDLGSNPGSRVGSHK